MPMKRIVQICSATLTVLFMLSAGAWQGYAQAAAYRTDLEYTYRRALGDLASYVSDMNVTLTKISYANTATQQSSMAGKLLEASGGAKAALAALPIGSDSLDTVSKFLAQTGDFSTVLSSKLAVGEELLEEDRTILQQLSQYCNVLAGNLNDIQQTIAQEEVSIGQAEDFVRNLEEKQPEFGEYFLGTAEEFANYPTLIYDGPFSDHMTQKTAESIGHARAFSQEEGRLAAAEYLELSPETLVFSGTTEGNLPLYNYTDGNLHIAVTQRGGYLTTMSNDRTIGEITLQLEEAKLYARQFLYRVYQMEFAETYYVIYDNICTIQYAYRKDGVVWYGDLIKVGVALDTGEIVQFNAGNFLMNHKERTAQNPRISEADARAQVSDTLTIESVRLAVIPTARESEPLCYELLCRGENGEQVLVYINGESGMEEEILILIETDDGVLTQ